MKKIACILLLVSLFTSCNKEDNNPAYSEQELTFNLTIDGMLPLDSRTISDMADFSTLGFDIAGYGTVNRFEDNVNRPDTKLPVPNIFNLNEDKIAVPHIIKKADNTYRSPLSKIPLLEGTYLSFFAWSQNKVLDKVSGIIESTDDERDTGFPYLKIVVPSAPSSQFDIVAAKSINHENDYVISAVDLDFNHLLSKLTFKATSSTNNQIKIEDVKINYGANKVYSGGTFTFAGGTPLGAYSNYNSYHSGQYALNSSYADIVNGSTSTLGDMLLMPQNLAEGFASLDITYKVVLYSGVEQRIVKSVPLKAINLAYGTNYVITLNITATEINVSAGSIANWIDGGTSLPLISGPRGDVMLLLDGKDAPYTHVDGKKYWLDRSGYNRHCQIMGNVPYNSTDKAYVFNNSTANYVLAPAINGPLTAATIQLVTATPGGSDQTAFYFSNQPINTTLTGTRTLFTCLNYRSEIRTYFDAGDFSGSNYDRINTPTNAITNAQYQAYSLYTFRKGVPFMGFSRNDSYHLTANDKTRPVNSATYNNIGWSYTGNIKYFKLTKRSITATEVTTDYSDLKKWCNLPDETPTTEDLLPPVRKNLILCLDGRSGIENIEGKNVWKDQSASGNHAEIIGSVTHNTDRFSFPGIRDSYMRFLTSMGTNQSFTIEFVVKSNSTTASTTLFAFTSRDNTTLDREFSTHYPWGNQVLIDSPYHNNVVSDIRLDKLPISGLPYLITDVNQWQVTRQSNVSNGYIGRMNGQTVGTNTPSTTLLEMRYNYIGCFSNKSSPFIGEVYSLRMYDRVLTDDELRLNRDFDKRVRNTP